MGIFSLFLFSSLGLGGYLGELTPLASLANYHSPSPYLSLYLSYSPSLEISFSFSPIKGKYGTGYSLNLKELRLLTFFPLFLREETRNISLLPGGGVALFERRVESHREGRYYPNFYFGFGYQERMEKIRFRINLLPNLILETGKRSSSVTNFYFLFKAELGVGYEF